VNKKRRELLKSARPFLSQAASIIERAAEQEGQSDLYLYVNGVQSKCYLPKERREHAALRKSEMYLS